MLPNVSVGIGIGNGPPDGLRPGLPPELRPAPPPVPPLTVHAKGGAEQPPLPAAKAAAAPAQPRPGAALDLFGGLLERFTDIVGDGAGYATFHFAAIQEGRLLGLGHGPAELGHLLQRADNILGQRSEVLESTPRLVRLRVQSSALLGGRSRVGTGIVLGFVEGLLAEVHRVAFAGHADPDGDAHLLHFAAQGAQGAQGA